MEKILKSKGEDFSIKGGNIGNDVNINVANLHLESLQDKEKSRHNGLNVSAGSSSVGAGVEYGNHDKSWVNEQSSIIERIVRILLLKENKFNRFSNRRRKYHIKNRWN